LSKRSAIIFQDFTRYPLTLAENVGIGNIERLADETAIEAALSRVGADATLNALPMGLSTLLGRQFDDGVDLSVGQWQGIALARAFFRDAPLIILDEPTAALDAEAEQAVFEAIHALSDGRTVVIISHRFSTVRSADRILVLDKGELMEEGSHRDLMLRNGIYARMFNLQASAYVSPEDAVVPDMPVGSSQSGFLSG
jgi:ATP-binding cassette subfamily B protein